MESPLIGSFPDGEWDCFGEMLANESPEFLRQSSLVFGENESSMFFSFDALNSNHLPYDISQESSYSSNCSGGTVFFANPPGHVKNYYFSECDQNILENTTACMSMDICMMDEKITVSLNEDGGNDSDHRHVELKRKLEVHESELPAEEDKENCNSAGIQKKKPRATTRDVHRCKKNAPPIKNNQKIAQNGNEEAEEEETNNTGLDGQSCVSSYSSEDDNNTSQRNSEKNGKKRASRGSATDPQSLYARKRRERINERLRILQNLVPNGTKVDISTMLEETVHYVKFLQLQIKLLSSDDLWMYAPIAYNGVDIGFNLSREISPDS